MQLLFRRVVLASALVVTLVASSSAHSDALVSTSACNLCTICAFLLHPTWFVFAKIWICSHFFCADRSGPQTELRNQCALCHNWRWLHRVNVPYATEEEACHEFDGAESHAVRARFARVGWPVCVVPKRQIGCFLFRRTRLRHMAGECSWHILCTESHGVQHKWCRVLAIQLAWDWLVAIQETKKDVCLATPR